MALIYFESKSCFFFIFVKKLTRMAVILGNDEDLRQLTFNNPLVVVKYHNENFAICRELFPQYEKISNMAKYKRFTFIRVDASENSVAQKLIEKGVYSFMAVYKKGLLIESRTISSPEDIRKVLDDVIADKI
jgi:thiol-disulfide isomerase/thioredoxin